MLGTAWKRWNWLDDGLLPLTATLMYAAWSYPLFALFLRNPPTESPGASQGSGFTFWFCIGVLVGGVVAGRLARENRMGIVIVVAGGLTAILILLLLSAPATSGNFDLGFADVLVRAVRGNAKDVVPVSLIVLICATILWWRGLRISTSAEQGEAMGAFVVGVVALGGLLLLALTLPSDSSVPPRTSRFLAPHSATPMFFLLSIPVALILAVLSQAIGEWGVVLSQLAIVLGLLALALVLPFGPSPESLSGWILLFLASGLVTLSLMGISRTLHEQERMTGIRMRVDRYWVITTLGIVAGILLLGLIIGQVVAPAALTRALSLLEPIWTFLVQVLLLLIFIFAYLFFSLFEPLLAEIQQRPPREISTFQSPLSSLADAEQLAKEGAGIPPIFITVVQIVLVLGVIAIVAFIFFTAARRQKRRVLVEDEKEVVETRETIVSADLLRNQLLDLLDGLRRKKPPPPFLEPGPPGDPRRIVREMYQKILAQAIELDAPRQKEQTPLTYRPTLQYLCPQEQGDLEVLTSAYVIARYSASPPSREQVRAAQEAFDRIDTALRSEPRHTTNW